MLCALGQLSAGGSPSLVSGVSMVPGQARKPQLPTVRCSAHDVVFKHEQGAHPPRQRKPSGAEASSGHRSALLSVGRGLSCDLCDKPLCPQKTDVQPSVSRRLRTGLRGPRVPVFELSAGQRCLDGSECPAAPASAALE